MTSGSALMAASPSASPVATAVSRRRSVASSRGYIARGVKHEGPPGVPGGPRCVRCQWRLVTRLGGEALRRAGHVLAAADADLVAPGHDHRADGVRALGAAAQVDLSRDALVVAHDADQVGVEQDAGRADAVAAVQADRHGAPARAGARAGDLDDRVAQGRAESGSGSRDRLRSGVLVVTLARLVLVV